MTSARTQSSCRKENIKNDCFNGTKINHRTSTQRIIALKIHNIHIFLIWKPNDISFNQAIKE